MFSLSVPSTSSSQATALFYFLAEMCLPLLFGPRLLRGLGDDNASDVTHWLENSYPPAEEMKRADQH